MPLPRRAPAATAAPAKTVAKAPAKAAVNGAGTVNFGDDSFYYTGFDLPVGDYAAFFEIKMHQITKKDGGNVGDPFLAVVATCYSLSNPGAEPFEQPYKMGTNAHKSFLPSENGKGLVPVPGGPAQGLSADSNWGIFRKSLRDSGLPEGILGSDVSVLDGIWIHVEHMPEPESRTAFKKAQALAKRAMTEQSSGEAVEEKPERPGIIPIVTEIKEGGKPWEGTGGMPTGATVAAAKPNGKAAPVQAAPASEEASEEDLKMAAASAIETVLTQGTNGTKIAKTVLRNEALKAVIAEYDEAIGAQVSQLVFDNPANLAAVLGELGYQVSGLSVVPA